MPIEVSIDERWRVSSITKSMMTTLATALVEQGLLSESNVITEAANEVIIVLLTRHGLIGE